MSARCSYLGYCDGRDCMGCNYNLDEQEADEDAEE